METSQTYQKLKAALEKENHLEVPKRIKESVYHRFLHLSHAHSAYWGEKNSENKDKLEFFHFVQAHFEIMHACEPIGSVLWVLLNHISRSLICYWGGVDSDHSPNKVAYIYKAAAIQVPLLSDIIFDFPIDYLNQEQKTSVFGGYDRFVKGTAIGIFQAGLELRVFDKLISHVAILCATKGFQGYSPEATAYEKTLSEVILKTLNDKEVNGIALAKKMLRQIREECGDQINSLPQYSISRMIIDRLVFYLFKNQLNQDPAKILQELDLQ